jgi:hypothetical protein
MRSRKVGTWANYYLRLNWMRTIVYLLGIGGYFYTLAIDRYELDLVSSIVLYLIGGVFIYVAFYVVWRQAKKAEVIRPS